MFFVAHIALLLMGYITHAFCACDFPEVDIDFAALKASCASVDDAEICKGCLQSIIDETVMKLPVDAFATFFPQIYDKEKHKFDATAMRHCVTPYIPKVIEENVFEPVTQALVLLDCDENAVGAVFKTAVMDLGLLELWTEDETVAEPVDEQPDCNIDYDFEGIDYTVLKEACADEDALCTACLQAVVDSYMNKLSDDDFAEHFPKFYDIEEHKIYPEMIRQCAAPMLPHLIEHEVFANLSKVSHILDCSIEDRANAYKSELKARNMTHLMKLDDE